MKKLQTIKASEKNEYLAIMQILEILKPMKKLVRQHVLLVVKDQVDSAQHRIDDE